MTYVDACDRRQKHAKYNNHDDEHFSLYNFHKEQFDFQWNHSAFLFYLLIFLCKSLFENCFRFLCLMKRFRAVYIAVMFVVSGMLVYSIFNIVSLKMEERSVIEKNEKLLKKKAELQKKLKKIKDSKYVENQAREQLKLIMPGETLYVFPEDDDDSGNSR